MARIDKTRYYLNIAKAVAARSTCLRRNYGCVIVKNDEIIATGYKRRGPRRRQLLRQIRYLSPQPQNPQLRRLQRLSGRPRRTERHAFRIPGRNAGRQSVPVRS